ncbi:membrane protein insertion efficiency factor YidD [[Mycobacterium] burgundiense]|uniref:Putative membrane protein insertion efficiency factor n=1 Tax=[Mycobacterium] burgundiense TaxID=3064286 RepID=A0ABM9M7Q1_9MYCO|nr:membrane protein insertion efficiency factor YidD [Mycolicibacterium sp. MU0053]CAJ1511265.1 membrane protein insertion efficiency factor YidD [Mycolicibacterium sp. MU0053]
MRTLLADLRSAPVRAVIFVIQLYRHMVSPLRLPTCRFMPTCSQYAVEALSEFGLIRGGWLAMVRLAKCGPWHRGGWDPIPERHPHPRQSPDLHADDGRNELHV